MTKNLISDNVYYIGKVKMNNYVFYFSIGLIETIGLLLFGKEFFFPSEKTRNNRILRSAISGLGSTISLIGLLLLLFYNISPTTFWAEWSILRITGFTTIVIFPLFCVLVVGNFVYYLTWEKFREIGRSRLKKIVNDSKKETL